MILRFTRLRLGHLFFFFVFIRFSSVLCFFVDQEFTVSCSFLPPLFKFILLMSLHLPGYQINSVSDSRSKISRTISRYGLCRFHIPVL